ncbi:RNA-directed RNA polymerase [ssRNA phage SRR5466728_2]|uniref:RNA-directed RNA polymerase n=1 Tax=ssRNA phage SRR5466728_2 TaxID=2786440 RepID=A0A8S5L4W0_9VIRU|nr:RNA-directed RNA polymerase [ssRNA phage SRR5466728_2]DAD52468.1 TPA_asm: RNA-directed RNA polymerase [ssRNA phage SRR5466728_2]
MPFCTASELQKHVEFDLDRCIGSNMQRVAGEYLRRSVVKKHLEMPGITTSEQDRAALEKFMAANRHCNSWRWSQDSKRDSIIDETIRLDLWRTLYGVYTLGDGLESVLPSNGASLGCRSNDVATKLFDSRKTVTNKRLLLHFDYWVGLTPWSAEAEKARVQRWGAFTLVKGSRLGFVPKTRDVSRSICTEPLVNSLHQHAIRVVLTNILLDRGIDLEYQQERNRSLAQQASLSGSHATIDLESASDTISVEFCRNFLPEDFFDVLMLTRSAYTQLPDGRNVKLGMISGQGNAFTFPLQTLIFQAICRACYRVCGVKSSLAVNGDDMIVDVRAFDTIVATLTRLGFIVNSSKTFSHGPFRESCGGDYYYGVNVRGVYAKDTHDLLSLFSVFNRLREWSLRHSISLFRTLLFLRRRIGDNALYVPWGNPTGGLACTRAQALRYGNIIPVSRGCLPKRVPVRYPRNEAARENGFIIYSYYSRNVVYEKDDIVKPLAALAAAASDRLTTRLVRNADGSNRNVVSTQPKRPSTVVAKKSICTSVWIAEHQLKK